MFDAGSGIPIVMIPGIQGRWEWMRPAIDALAARWRVVAASLPGEPGTARAAGDRTFDQFVDYVDGIFEAARIERAVLCGVSFGGLIALRYAAVRRDRVLALILVSAPGPRWRPTDNQSRYMRSPLLTIPAFLAGASARVWRELAAAIPDWRARLAFCARWSLVVLTAPGIPWRMSMRGRLAVATDFTGDCRQIACPTLVVTGEPALDKVVPTSDTMAYATAIAGARSAQLSRTGHLGTATAPDRFAAIVTDFLESVPL